MPLTIILTASPGTITGYYPGSTESSSLVTARVYDYFGSPVSNDIILDWTTSAGSLSAYSTQTSTAGQASVNLTAPSAVGSVTITATAREFGGSAVVTITLIDKWVATSPTYTAWQNVGSLHSCSAWSPAASTVTSGAAFTQTRFCLQDQRRERQNREQSLVTGAYRNVGSPVTETQSISISQSQAAVGTKAVATCTFSGNINNPGSMVVRWDGYTFFKNGSNLGKYGSTSITSGGVEYYAGAKRQTYSIASGGGITITGYELCMR